MLGFVRFGEVWLGLVVLLGLVRFGLVWHFSTSAEHVFFTVVENHQMSHLNFRDKN